MSLARLKTFYFAIYSKELRWRKALCCPPHTRLEIPTLPSPKFQKLPLLPLSMLTMFLSLPHLPSYSHIQLSLMLKRKFMQPPLLQKNNMIQPLLLPRPLPRAPQLLP